MKDHPHAIRIRRLSGCALAAALLLSGAPALAQTFPTDAQWIPLTRGGSPLGDVAWDSQGYPDIVGDHASPAAYVFLDSKFMYFRLRVNKPALLEMPANFAPFGWVCLLDVDGDPSAYELSAGLGGEAPDAVELWRNLAQVSPGDFADPSELLLASYPASGAARQTSAPSQFGEGDDHFVDWVIAQDDVLLGAQVKGPIRFACGSSLKPLSLSGDFIGPAEATALVEIESDPLVCDKEACWESPCLGAGQACSVGVGTCAQPGVTVCDGEGQAVCNAIPASPSDEVCDGMDNDCDGEVDEGLGVGAPCSVGLGACAASGVFVCTDDRKVQCSAIPGEGGKERCDGIDNDCDGVVDNGFEIGAHCSVGLGACQATGTMVCADPERSTCSAQAGIPAYEVCDGIDNDCGGAADESYKLGASCSAGVGLCAVRGIIACTATGAAACNAVPLAGEAEACDGLDNDCDGVIDNGFGVGLPCVVGDGGCARAGVIACDVDGVPRCDAQPATPGAEVCDGLDNDCDGVVDNGFDIGQPCGVGAGACFGLGEIVCAPDGTPVCSVAPGEAKEEVCDGIDNDCDGVPDNNLHLGTPCSVGVGACERVGKQTCSATGTTVCDVLPGEPQKELCDGLDNDCDGVTDEGCTAPKGCESDADCGSHKSGLVCDANSHACVAGCRAVGNGCPDGYLCTSQSLDIGKCVLPPAEIGCHSDPQCAPGEICDSLSHACVEGCRSDVSCGAPFSGQICEAASHSCVKGCEDDADCGAPKSGLVCDAFLRRCVAGCNDDSDCAVSGQICDAASRLCAVGCRNTAGCPSSQVCVVESGDAGQCALGMDALLPGGGPSCAVPSGAPTRDMTAYLLLTLASLAAARRRRL